MQEKALFEGAFLNQPLLVNRLTSEFVAGTREFTQDPKSYLISAFKGDGVGGRRRKTLLRFGLAIGIVVYAMFFGAILLLWAMHARAQNAEEAEEQVHMINPDDFKMQQIEMPTPMAGRVATISHRSDPKEPVVVNLSRDATQAPASNVEIFPGDTIMVGKAGVVYVVGAVTKPGGFPMDANEGLTVLQVLALAEGSKPDAALDKSKLIRKTANGPVEVPIPLNKILSSKTADQKLQTDDILFVPNSAAKSAAKRSLEAIIQAATGVAIYSRR